MSLSNSHLHQMLLVVINKLSGFRLDIWLFLLGRNCSVKFVSLVYPFWCGFRVVVLFYCPADGSRFCWRILRFCISPSTLCNAADPLAVKQHQIMMLPPPRFTLFLGSSDHWVQTIHLYLIWQQNFHQEALFFVHVFSCNLQAWMSWFWSRSFFLLSHGDVKLSWL